MLVALINFRRFYCSNRINLVIFIVLIALIFVIFTVLNRINLSESFYYSNRINLSRGISLVNPELGHLALEAAAKHELVEAEPLRSRRREKLFGVLCRVGVCRVCVRAVEIEQRAAVDFSHFDARGRELAVLEEAEHLLLAPVRQAMVRCGRDGNFVNN